MQETYTVRAYSAGGCFSTSLPTTILVVAARTAAPGYNEPSPVALTAYPNPAHENVYFDFNSITEKEYTISLVDIQGRVILEQKVNATVGLNHVELDLEAFQHGIYFDILSAVMFERRLRLLLNPLDGIKIL
ncbi:MAG: T9SS type A sorting domain-containing protein [Bacteroidetes bacterium]|nr:T9SS type A sorting domain-containing protein [Bacteroidota bacterium]